MTRRERQLLEWIRENPCISQQELADKAGITRSSAAVHISNLMRKGYIAGRGYLLREAPYIAVVGGVNMDIGAVSHDPLVPRDSNPGKVTTSLGGVGRNIAHNLCLLGQQVSMVTVLGQDSFAQSVRDNAAAIGLDLSHSAVIPGGRTGTYLFIAGSDGDMALAVNDMAIYDHITPDFLRQRLEFINRAGLVVVETNLPEESLQWLCQHCTAPILADPVSTIKARRLEPVLGKLTALKPNRMEAELLSGVTIRDEADVQKAAKVLLDKGVQQVYISLGSDGLYAEDQAGRHGRLPCPKVQVVNATGGGDAMAAALAVLGKKQGRRIAVLGDMLELGDCTQAEHYRVGRIAAEKADFVFAYGPNSGRIISGTITGGMPETRGRAFTNREELVAALKRTAKPGDVLLFKASHGIHLEQVIDAFLGEEK